MNSGSLGFHSTISEPKNALQILESEKKHTNPNTNPNTNPKKSRNPQPSANVDENLPIRRPVPARRPGPTRKSANPRPPNPRPPQEESRLPPASLSIANPVAIDSADTNDVENDENDFMMRTLRRRMDSLEEYSSRISNRLGKLLERLESLESNTRATGDIKWVHGTITCDLPLYHKFDDISIDKYTKTAHRGTRLIFVHPTRPFREGTFMQCRICDSSGDVETYWVQVYDKELDQSHVVGWSL